MSIQNIIKNFRAVVKAHPFIAAAAILSAALFLLFVWIEIKAELIISKPTAPTYDLAIIQLREQQEREQTTLAGYRLIDPERGVVQIPIERAMELIVEENKAKVNVSTR